MDVNLNEASALPLNRQAENYLRALVAQEPYSQGALLPTEVELAKRLGVARNTVRTAMDKLVREGLVTRKKGVGTQVRLQPIATELARWNSFTLELGDRMRTVERVVRWAPAQAEIAAELGVQPGVPVCCLERLKGTDSERMALLLSFFPARLGIAPDEQFEGRLYQVLESRYGARAVESREEIGAQMAGTDKARRLGLPPEVPLLYRKRHVLDAQGQLVELAYAFYRADRFVYRINLQMEEET